MILITRELYGWTSCSFRQNRCEKSPLKTWSKLIQPVIVLTDHITMNQSKQSHHDTPKMTPRQVSEHLLRYPKLTDVSHQFWKSFTRSVKRKEINCQACKFCRDRPEYNLLLPLKKLLWISELRSRKLWKWEILIYWCSTNLQIKCVSRLGVVCKWWRKWKINVDLKIDWWKAYLHAVQSYTLSVRVCVCVCVV